MPLPRRQPLTPRPVRRPPRAAYRIPGAPPIDVADDADTDTAAAVDDRSATAVPRAADPRAQRVVAGNPGARTSPGTAEFGHTRDVERVSVTEAAPPAATGPATPRQQTPPLAAAPTTTSASDWFQETAALDAPSFTTVVPADDSQTNGDTAHVAQSIEAAAQRQRVQRAVGPVAVAGAGAGAVPGHGSRRVGQRVAAGAGAGAGAADGRNGRGGPPRNGHPRAIDPRPRWRRPRTWFMGFGFVVALMVLAVAVYAGYMGWTAWRAYNKAHVETPERQHIAINEQGTPVVLPTHEAEAQLPNWDNDDPINILLLGIDYRDGDEEPARSDTVMVVRIEPATGNVRMLSIPRDLLVEIPGHGEDKMNAAYPLGEHDAEEAGTNFGGPALVATTIERNFDIPIHYFMTVDFEGFRKIVDTVGGVIVDVRSPVKDDQYPTEDFGLTREYFPTGLQFMDGETALRYARTRHGDNDVNRGQRQQQVLRAIREQAMTLGLITRADDLMRDLADTVRTDLNFNQMLALANMGRSLDTNSIESVDLWEMGIITEHLPEWEGDAFYFEADWNMIWAVTGELFPRPGETPTGSIDLPDTSTTSGSGATGGMNSDAAGSVNSPISEESTASGINFGVPIAVRDYTTSGTGADTIAQVLVDDGFSLVVPEPTADIATVTSIYNYSANDDTALRIANLLGLGPESIIDASDGVGIVVLLGDDVATQFNP